MRPRLSRALPAALAATLAACGGTRAPGAAPAPDAAPARANPDLITEAEIRAGQYRDAYHVVERLRPQYLRSRGATNPNDRQGATTAPIVYLNNQRYGTIESLRDIPAVQVREIRWLSPRDATTRFGTGTTVGGVIVVVTRGQ